MSNKLKHKCKTYDIILIGKTDNITISLNNKLKEDCIIFPNDIEYIGEVLIGKELYPIFRISEVILRVLNRRYIQTVLKLFQTYLNEALYINSKGNILYKDIVWINIRVNAGKQATCL